MPRLRQPRQANHQEPFSPYGPIVVNSTITSPIDDVWGQLRSLTFENRFVAIACAHGQTRAAAAAVFPTVRHFLLQAEEFFRAARASSLRAAPLLDYYAIMNLAKTLIAFRRPRLVSGPIRHGLSVLRTAATPRQTVLRTASDGVFVALSQILTGQLPPPTFTVDELLSRMVDISAEYGQAYGPPVNVSYGHAWLRANREQRRAWLVLEIAPAQSSRHSLNALAWPGSPYPAILRRVAHPRGLVVLEGPEVAYSARGPGWNAALRSVRQHLVSLRPYLSDVRLNAGLAEFRVLGFTAPFSSGPLHELNALLATSYFLSDTVRYRPAFWDESAKSDDAWILATFTRTAPLKAVRLIHNYLFASDYVLRQV